MHGGSLEELFSQPCPEPVSEFLLHRGFCVMRLPRGVPPLTGPIYQFCPMVMPQPSAVNGPRTIDLLDANWVVMDAEAAHGERYLRPPGRAADAPFKATSGHS